MPLKLPRYMFRRANGSFRYKRNVPKDLRTVIPKATVYRQLGNTYQDALRALPKVHADIDALFDRERRTTDEQRAKELVRERLGEHHQSMFIEGAVDPEWQSTTTSKSWRRKWTGCAQGCVAAAQGWVFEGSTYVSVSCAG